MAKKQEVVEKEFTLDLTNLSKIGKGKVAPKKDEPVQEVEKTTQIDESRREAPKTNTETETKITAPIQPSIKMKKHLRLVVSKDLFTEFEAFFKRFVEETETYWVNTSRVHVFVLGTLCLEQKYKKAKTYHQAPEDFVKFVSRKGNRPKSEESTLRKADATPMFFEVSPEVFQAYFNLIYSFLIAKNDVHNLSYSASYFFKDFLNLLQNGFKAFCTFGKKNS